MKRLKVYYKKLSFLIFSFFLIFLISRFVFANEIVIKIEGNKFTDSEVILSLLNEIPKDSKKDYSNIIIKTLNDSNLFSDVQIKLVENEYIIFVSEYPNIDKLKFINNNRLKDEDLRFIASEINFIRYNSSSLDLYLNEIKKFYESFGFNNVQIEHSKNLDFNTNTVNLTFDINEGKITKINKIIFKGNNKILVDNIRDIIVSKTKSLTDIFANNNFKPKVVEKDKYLIINYYKNNGYVDVKVKTKIEYLKNNKVNIYFDIEEGNQYLLSNIDISDNNNLLDSNVFNLIISKKNTFISDQNFFSFQEINNFKDIISSIIIDNGIDYFDINTLDKVEGNNITILLEINPIIPKYTKLINIVGNSRTYDYVIRRELNLVEGDAFNSTQLKSIRDKLNALNLFESVNIREEVIDNNFSNLVIEVKEKQTGSFNAGVAVGTLDGFSIVTGLRERNFYGTGRSLDVLVNTSSDNNELKLITTDRLSYENDANISYKINYKQRDYSNSSAYKLNTLTSGLGIGYKINKKLFHNFDIEYVIKDYVVTDTSTVSRSILDSSGSNISYLIKNNIRFSNLNSGFILKQGRYIDYKNTIETPTSSSNGYLKNIITFKNYYTNSSNSIFSTQAKIGNIFSLNNNDILIDNKFSLGGRWLRGFDSFGAGPRNSRNSYVGGNNIIATKLDYSFELSNNSDFPIYLNLFNDYGLVWENKTTPTQSDNSLRSSVGFGIKYYSPIGPMGFSWGFPIMDEDYDIKRMFLFSIGNID